MVDRMFTATKGFVVHDGKVLLLRESCRYEDGSNAGRFDIVGGRVEKGERFDDSLVREIQEETSLDVVIGKPFFVNEWRPEVRDEKWQIIGIFFVCTSENDEITLSGDHDEYIWIDPKEYKNYNIIPNLYPAFEAFLECNND